MSKAISERISDLIDDIGEEGYGLEMEMQKVRSASPGTQKRVRVLAKICQKLEAVMTYAQDNGL